MPDSREKIPVAVLGATGMVGQKLLELLNDHPWFEVCALMASDRSAGKKYGEAVNWKMASPLPDKYKSIMIQPCLPEPHYKLVLSSLSSNIAGPIELSFAQAGCIVISNSAFYRMHASVPLLIPELNATHLNLLTTQNFAAGKIITNPNCSAVGIALALKPLTAKWQIEACSVVTLQAISGAGYPGVSAYDMIDNIIPHIADEEEKIENEIVKILGTYQDKKIIPYPMQVSAQCNRVPVLDGHLACLSIKFKNAISKNEILQAWQNFLNPLNDLNLPSCPKDLIVYHQESHYPQPRLHRYLNQGMGISIGNLRPCPLFVNGWKFNLLSHNTIRGAAGGALLNAELIVKKNYENLNITKDDSILSHFKLK